MDTFYDRTAKRLASYYSFSPQTIKAVATFAQKQAAFTNYEDFFQSVGMPEAQVYTLRKKQGAVVIDIKPRQPQTRVLVVHLPMGNPLDPNQQYQLATLAGVFPDARIIGFANPSGGSYKFREHNLTVLQKLGIATTIHPKPLVAAELAYLQQQQIKDAQYIGFSFGALKALLAATYAPAGAVKGLVTIELVSHPRGPKKLLNDFQDTLEPLGAYVEATALPTFWQARNASASGHDYNTGLLRPINLAIGMLVSRLDALKQARQVLETRKDLHLTMAWGTKSELVDTQRMNTWVAAAKTEFPGRVQSFALQNLKHGLANDVHLHAAIIYEALLRQP